MHTMPEQIQWNKIETCDKYGEKTAVQKFIFQRYFPTGKIKQTED